MTDATLRALELASLAEPSNEAARLRLDQARLRAGLGWHGETLPDDERDERDYPFMLTTANERGVYDCSIWGPSGVHSLVTLPLVYVPGAELPCEHPSNRGRAEDSSVALNSPPRVCKDCNGSGLVKIAPFYVGRFPVTWGEHRVFCKATSRALPESPWRAHFETTDWTLRVLDHPVVNITHADARAFCSWAGLRLPTAQEWRWAAMGPPREKGCGYCSGTGARHVEGRPNGLGYPCVACGGGVGIPRDGTGRGVPRFPWGNEPPSPERCAAADPRYAGRSTAPVVVLECALCDARDPHARAYPARPAGASWCGAHDMVGNVEHWLSCGRVVGFSFSSSQNRRWDTAIRHDDPVDVGESFSDVGFRVALSAAE